MIHLRPAYYDTDYRELMLMINAMVLLRGLGWTALAPKTHERRHPAPAVRAGSAALLGLAPGHQDSYYYTAERKHSLGQRFEGGPKVPLEEPL
jgi:hypothetical protein